MKHDQDCVACEAGIPYLVVTKSPPVSSLWAGSLRVGLSVPKAPWPWHVTEGQ